MSKKLLALLLCALLLLGMTGCLEKTEKPEEEPVAAADVETDAGANDALPAFTLGNFTVTVGELRSSYDLVMQYFSLYGMAVPTDPEEVKQYRDMIIEDMLSGKVLPWKAQEMGIELTEEKKEQIKQQVEERISEYAAEFMDEAQAELGENATAAELALKAREFLKKDVEDFFEYPYEQWLEQDVTAAFREDAYAELLQEKFNEGVSVSEEDARVWFETELADQKSSFEKDYTAFKSRIEENKLGESDALVLYTPEGFARMQVIAFDVDADDSATHSANELEMTNLEAEYGKLVLQGKDEERQTEILTRYQELQEKNEELIKKISEKAEQARADALNGVDFAKIFETYAQQEGSGSVEYFGYVKDEPKQDGTVIFYTREKDADWPEEVWQAAKDMQDGEISELLQVGDSFYLIKRLSDLPAGAADFSDDVAAYTAAALAAKQVEEWEAVQEDWLNEARNAVVFYEDNYANVGMQ